jgi:hypothetical protein
VREEGETMKTLKLPLVPVQLTDESDSECCCSCGGDAYPFTVEGFDGYVDAAPGCAASMLEDAIRGLPHDYVLEGAVTP